MRYKELEIWKRSYQVVLQVYSLLKTCRDHGLKDQISRSAVSVPSNIAEGSERGSYIFVFFILLKVLVRS